ncbi:MAG TPA: hypothetical protein VK034_30450 [Enhygromyxa sp.]|nr:hypothetical protein [Enhygromyxa sp.]
MGHPLARIEPPGLDPKAQRATREAGRTRSGRIWIEPEARHPPICYLLPGDPERVLEVLLADDRVTAARLSTLGSLRSPGIRFVLERIESDPQLRFILACPASEPGVWEPGAYAVLEGRVAPRPGGGSELILRFRLHPLTRAAYLTVLVIAALIIPLQMWTTGLLLGTVMMFPIVLAAAVIGLDSRRLGHQRAQLQRLVEEVFEPLALAREPGERGPFRTLALAGPHAPSEIGSGRDSKRGTLCSRSRRPKKRSR